MIQIRCDVTSYGDQFKKWRDARHLKQPQLARLLFGDAKRQASVSQIERTAGRLPHPDSIKKHAAVLRVTIKDLVGDVDDLWIDRARRGEFDRVAPPFDVTKEAERITRLEKQQQARGRKR